MDELTARLAHIEHHAAALIGALVHEARIAPAMYPAIWEQITALRVAQPHGRSEYRRAHDDPRGHRGR